MRAVVLIAALLLTLLAPPAEGAAPGWGTVSARDGVLKKGCRTHPYRYALTPPEGDWALETFLVGPGGEHLASDQLVVGHDPVAGTKRFRICRATTRPGRFRVRALLHVDNGPDESLETWLPTASFRLRPPTNA